MKSDAQAKRRSEIEAAAYDILASSGYDGLSMLGVARASKASNETLYRWYGDKMGLFAALIARNLETTHMILEEARNGPAEAALIRVGTELASMLLGDRAVALNRAAAADPSDRLGAALVKGGRDRTLPLIADVIARLSAEGILGTGAPKAMAEDWLAHLVGDMQLRRIIGTLPAPSPKDTADRAEQALAALKQLYPPGPAP